MSRHAHLLAQFAPRSHNRFRLLGAFASFTILLVTLTCARSASAGPALTKEPVSAEPQFQTVVFSGKADPNFRYEVRTLGADKQVISSFPVYAGDGKVQSGDTLRIDGALSVQTAVWQKDELVALSEPRAFEPGASLELALPKGLGYLAVVPVTLSVGEVQVSDELRRYDFNLIDVKGRQVPIDPTRVSWMYPFGPEVTPVIPKPPLGCSVNAPLCIFLPEGRKEKPIVPLTVCLGPLCGATTSPPSSPQVWRRIAAGPDFTCGLTSTGRVLCWGEQIAGQLGQPTTQCVVPPNAPPGAQCAWVPKEIVQPPGSLVTFQALDVGDAYACAIDTAGGLWCWGTLPSAYGSFCQSGASTCNRSPFRLNPIDPTMSNTPARFKDVSVGSDTACAITQAGSVVCFAEWHLGEDPSHVPDTFRAVGTLNGYTSVSSGYVNNCALTVAGRVECWGFFSEGRNGNNPRDVMSEHTNISTARAVSAGRFRTCVLGTNGTLSCLDVGHSGQSRPSVESLDPRTTDLEISLNDASSKCQVESGFLYCDLWQFGISDTLLGSDVVDSSLESFHGCAVESSGKAWCWGDNDRGQLGDGTTRYADPLRPAAVLMP